MSAALRAVALNIVLVYSEFMTLGQLLRKARKKTGLTQADVAHKLKKTQPTVFSWENDEAVPSLRDVPRIAKLYGVTSAEMLACRMPAPATAKTA
jgi:transcriptional regulator with XRE-family HTH domain